MRTTPAWQRSWSLYCHRLGTPAIVLEKWHPVRGRRCADKG